MPDLKKEKHLEDSKHGSDEEYHIDVYHTISFDFISTCSSERTTTARWINGRNDLVSSTLGFWKDFFVGLSSPF